MYPVAQAEWTIRATPATYADEWGVAPRRNLRKRRYYRRGKWLTPSSQKARRLAHWFLSPMSATPLPARRKAGMLRVAITSRWEIRERSHRHCSQEPRECQRVEVA